MVIEIRQRCLGGEETNWKGVEGNFVKTPSKDTLRDLSDGPVGKSLHSQCRGPSSIPGWGTKSHMHAATKSLHTATVSPPAATKKQRSCMLQLRPSAAKNK